ncbi:MAG: hypothetical protein A3J60_02575 [Candidatus Pacebacteria bacterium RIFCSPHIGHO2_02_FULL_46_9]|nr:MAG: hypothetical protein A3J60_02575 [Candidatus Pacebacteria bacterium RIFCSPHIGHO2_02_FULL_46_9]
MLLKSRFGWLSVGLLVSLVVVLDQVSKWQATQTTINPGVGLGLAAQFISQQQLAFGTVGILIVLWVVAQAWWQRSVVATGLFFGGAISNVLDRLLYGGVRDWLVLPGTGLHNNVADWAIFFGLAWLLRLSLATAAKGQQ